MTFEAEGVRAPSYTVRLMVEEAGRRLGESTQEASIRQVLLQIAGEALQAEREHILSATRDLLQKTEETIHQLERERLDSIDTFFEGLEDARDDETIAPRRPQEMLEELSNLTRTLLRLSSEELRALPPEQAAALVEVKRAAAEQVRQLAADRARRLRGTVEQNHPSTEPRRDGPSLGL